MTLKNRWLGWITEHADKISSDQEEVLLRAFLDGLTRTGPRWKAFSAVADAIGLTDEANVLRRSLNNSRYALSCFWRAVWVCAAGQDIPWAAKHFGVSEEDVWWAMTRMSAEQLEALHDRALFEAWVPNPDRQAIEKTVLAIVPFCTRYVNKHMQFILRYDQSLTVADFVNEIYLFGLAATYRYDAKITDLVHLRNYAWISAKNRAKHLIAHHTRQSRARIQRVIQTEQAPVEVSIATRVACRRCNKVSMIPICKPCATELAADPVAAWNWKRESAHKFLVERSNRKIVLSRPKPIDTFQSNVVSMDPTVKHGEDDMPHRQFADDSVPDISADLSNGLSKKPWRVQQICRIVLGLEMPIDFHRWLAGRHVKQNISDKKLVQEACFFYGLTRDELRDSTEDLVK